MPPIKVTHPSSGQSVMYHENNGRRYPNVPFHDLDLSIPAIRDLPCRDDDVTVLSFPKAGTHWVFEIVCILIHGNPDPSRSSQEKGKGMIDIQPTAAINDMPSPRTLNSHLLPDEIPQELISRKTKLIYIARNPKDTFVSFYFHSKKMKFYESSLDWNSYFDFALEGKTDYGSWFDYTKKWETFFGDHPELPVLKLTYEEMKKDLGAAVDKIAAHLDKPLTDARRREIIDRCDFSIMKSANQKSEGLKMFAVGDEHPIFRKGTIGDWKNYFTVAQNERFDQEYKTQMKGYQLDFEQFM